MMGLFRAFAKSKAAIVLMGLLILSFGVWGISDVFHARITDAVVTAGSRTVSRADFKMAFERQLRANQEQSGQAMSTQEAVGQGFDRWLLTQLSDQESIMEAIHRAGVTPSEKLVPAELRKTPAFFNPVTGAFDQKSYESLLGQNGLTPVKYEKDLLDQIAEDHFTTGLVNGLRIPRTYAAVVAAMMLEGRSAEYLVVEPRAVGIPAPPTEAQLQAFLKEHEARLKQPESRSISLVRFSAQALAQTLPADPAAVQKQFDAQKARLSSPEKRSFVEIPAKDAGQAAAIAARLAKGEDPAAVARAVGAKPIVYADALEGGVADKAVGEAVFGLQPGQSTGPVRGEFGFAVAKLTKITPAKAASLEEARPAIEAAVKSDAAQNKVYDQVQKYDDVHASGAPMAKAAAAAGVQVYQIGPITAEGRNTTTGQPQTGMSKKMLEDAFSLPQGGETEIVDLGKGEYYALRIDRVNPSAVPPLDQIRPMLTQAWMQQEMVKRLQARAGELAARIKKGESLQAVAASAGAKVLQVQGLNRGVAQSRQDLGQDFLGQLFQAKPGAVYTAGVQGGVAVARVTQVAPGPVDQVARLSEQGRPQLTAQMLQEEITDLTRSAARAEVKPKVDQKLARQALGVADEDAPAASGAKPAGPGGKS